VKRRHPILLRFIGTTSRETPRSSGVVAEGGGAVVGFVLDQGVGKGLLGRLETDLKAQGVDKVYLLTAREDAAEAFYHACGFYTSEKMAMPGKYL